MSKIGNIDLEAVSIPVDARLLDVAMLLVLGEIQ